MIIGLDLDGVCADFQHGWVDAYNRWFDATIDPKAAETWDALVELTHFETEAEFFHWADTLHPTFWADLPAVAGFQAGVVTLTAAGHRLVVVTNRSTLATEGTQVWLKQHWPNVQTPQLHFTAGSKAIVPTQINVDDSPTVIKDLLSNQRQVIRFDRPWNQRVKATAVAKNWAELTKMFLEMGEAIA